jgi:hypothetical protein
MPGDELARVLANWIDQASSPLGELPPGADPATWVASRFAEWWRRRTEETLGDAEAAASGLRAELERLGGWKAFGEAMHELGHLEEALAELRSMTDPSMGAGSSGLQPD